MNRLQVIGRVGHDPEIKENMTSFSVCSSEAYKDKDGNWQEKTQWHNVAAWGYLATKAAKVERGQTVYVKGPFETRKYQTKSGEEKTAFGIKAERIEFFSPKRASDAAANTDPY